MPSKSWGLADRPQRFEEPTPKLLGQFPVETILRPHQPIHSAVCFSRHSRFAPHCRSLQHLSAVVMPCQTLFISCWTHAQSDACAIRSNRLNVCSNGVGIKLIVEAKPTK